MISIDECGYDTLINENIDTIYAITSFDYPDTMCPLVQILPDPKIEFMEWYKNPGDVYKYYPAIQMMTSPKVLQCGIIGKALFLSTVCDWIREYYIPPIKQYELTLRIMKHKDYIETYNGN